jgi:uncharacterized repeat protein (TIGR03803 family)
VALLSLAFGTAASLQAQSAARADRQSAKQAQAGTYSLLYSFRCSPDGHLPQTGLVRDPLGNLYGTTNAGGQYGDGTVFEIAPGGAERVLHSFAGSPADGAGSILQSLVLDAAGDLYGTTTAGGEFGGGTVFKVTATGTESVLYNFCSQPDCTDGQFPQGGVALDSAGNIYGTTFWGGTYNSGVVFKLTSDGTYTVLHSFENSPTDGGFPTGNLTRDSSGNLYGTTDSGGAFSDGTVFKVTASGAESLLHTFEGYPADGTDPYGGGLLLDAAGNLYGVTTQGGAYGFGVLFRLTPARTERVLFNFTAAGAAPIDGLARDAAGNLYGTTQAGGTGGYCGIYGCGVLFEFTAGGRGIVLHDFTLDSSSPGAGPLGGVVRDPSGNLYGTLDEGGVYGCGAVFKYAP